MTIEVVSRDDSTTRLKISQQITFTDVEGNIDPLIRLLGDDVYQNQVLIDMSGSDYIDSSGVGWLVASHKKFIAAGGRMVLHSFQPEVKKIMTVLRMDHVLNMSKNEAEANNLELG